MRLFNPSAKQSARALQAWQILVGKAENNQTITYEALSILMYGKKAAGVLDKILYHIAYFCQENDLPPLTVLVVGKHRGTPGEGIPVDFAQYNSERERVFGYDWYNVYPPSEDELSKAFREKQDA